MRAIITLEILARMEELLAKGNSDFVLSDYFDYIGGTSAGAIIASALALGHHIGEVREMFRDMGAEVFRRRRLPARVRSLYRDGALTRQLETFLGSDMLLGSDEIRTLLLIVLHRVDTDSLWPLSNNTRAMFNDRSRPDCNLDLRLPQLVRGSTAAPVFFEPEEIVIGGKVALFEDGGVTPFNNPAPLLFQMATSPQYRLGWPTGVHNLLLVSVGSGSASATHAELQRRRVNVVFQAKNLVKVIMNGSSVQNDRFCRLLGDCRHGPRLDEEFEGYKRKEIPVREPSFAYVRYDADISARGLAAMGLSGIDSRKVARLDSVAATDDLVRIGLKAADEVRVRHFAGFDLQA